MPQYISVVPAYGRDYKSQKEVKDAWAAGHDFLAQTPFSSGYISIRDAKPGMVLNVRYSRLTKVLPITIK